MTSHGFASAFAQDLEDYLAFKQAMGFTGKSRVWYLKQFDAYCVRGNLGVFDKATVEGWVAERLATAGAYRSWMSYIRDFGRWLAAHRDRDAYVLAGAWKAGVARPEPYLFTADQIERFFAAASSLDTTTTWAWQATAFFVLMHSCGLRTGEVRALKPPNVDLAGKAVTILAAKGHRDRRLPITGDVAGILADCDHTARRRFPARATFFVTTTGARVDQASVGVWFRRIWKAAGLAYPASGPRPRPYDFRHHFAYANIERWAATGVDATAMLPYLAAYMGHASVESTFHYVHTSPDFMNAYATTAQATTSSRLPQVGFE